MALLSKGDHQTTISYEVDISVPDLDYIPEASRDLTMWVPVDTDPAAMVHGKQTRSLVESTAGPSHRFYRLGIIIKA
jgi:hypothetical protein